MERTLWRMARKGRFKLALPIPCHLPRASSRGRPRGSSSLDAFSPPRIYDSSTHSYTRKSRRCGTAGPQHSHTWPGLAVVPSPATPVPSLLTFIPLYLATDEHRATTVEIHASLNNPGPRRSSGSLRGEIIFGRPVLRIAARYFT